MSIGKSRKFVYYRHTNPQTKKELTDNMPLSDWEDIQLDRVRKNQFEFIKEVDLDNPNKEAKEKAVEKSETLEIEEDVLECPLCGYVAKSETSLKSHKTKKHK